MSLKQNLNKLSVSQKLLQFQVQINNKNKFTKIFDILQYTYK